MENSKNDNGEEDFHSLEEEVTHPYAEAIEKCPYNDWQRKAREIEPIKTLEETPFTLVNTKELLQQMMCKLKSVSEFAVTAKRRNHSINENSSCCFLIATRCEDFLLDSLALKDSLQILNEVFTNPNILKVMIKSKKQIEFLQRDFLLYMVNMFDLTIAARKIRNEGNERDFNGGLPHLLKHYCGVSVREHDVGTKWHVRPLPSEKITHARKEIHYLLHIKDKLRNSLVEMNMLDDVYLLCNTQCNVVVVNGASEVKSGYPRNANYMTLYKSMRVNLTRLQLEVFRVLYTWREDTALQERKSPVGLLSNKLLVTIAKQLPRDVRALRDCFSSCQISSTVEENMNVLQELVTKAISVGRALKDSVKIVPFSLEQCGDCGKNKKNNFKTKMMRQFGEVDRQTHGARSQPYPKGPIPAPAGRDSRNVQYKWGSNLEMGAPICPGIGAGISHQTDERGKVWAPPPHERPMYVDPYL